MLLATCLAVAEYNSGVKETTEQPYGAMGMTAGPHLAAGDEGGPEATQAVPAPDRVTNKGSQACTQTVC